MVNKILKNNYAKVTQMVEQSIRNLTASVKAFANKFARHQQVVGSSPIFSSIKGLYK